MFYHGHMEGAALPPGSIPGRRARAYPFSKSSKRRGTVNSGPRKAGAKACNGKRAQRHSGGWRPIHDGAGARAVGSRERPAIRPLITACRKRETQLVVSAAATLPGCGATPPEAATGDTRGNTSFRLLRRSRGPGRGHMPRAGRRAWWTFGEGTARPAVRFRSPPPPPKGAITGRERGEQKGREPFLTDGQPERRPPSFSCRSIQGDKRQYDRRQLPIYRGRRRRPPCRRKSTSQTAPACPGDKGRGTSSAGREPMRAYVMPGTRPRDGAFPSARASARSAERKRE